MNTRHIRPLLLTSIAALIAFALFVLYASSITRAAAPQLPTGIDVHVDTTADTYSGVGCSLRDAIQTINSGADHGGCARVNNLTAFDRVLLPSGTYSLTLSGTNEDFNVTGDLDIRRSMIISATGTTLPIVTANSGWDDRIFDVVTETVTIKGLVISGGAETSTVGGGVLIEHGASLTMKDSVVADNSAASGGGIFNAEGTLMLDTVTIDGNTVNNSGGGIYNNGSLTLSHVTLDGNSATDGGGIYAYYGTMIATNVTISANSAGRYGGGIFGGPITLTNVTISNNRAGIYGGGDGGGIDGSFLTLTNVTLSGNSAEDNGGGISNNLGPLIFTNGTVFSNTATTGGGITNFGTATLMSVTLSSNSTSGGGDGIYNFVGATLALSNSTVSGNGQGIGNVGAMKLTNVTLSGNSVNGIGNAGTMELTNVTVNGTNGYGIYQIGNAYTETIILSNTIIANSTRTNCYVFSIPIISNGYNLSSDGSCTPYFDGPGDLNNTNPHLGPLQDNGGPTQTHAPLQGSPAIDAIPFGTNGCGTTLTTDQRGVTRPIHGKCDIGAYEADYFDMFLPLIKK
jgi:CSLREA domain-containing protein